MSERALTNGYVQLLVFCRGNVHIWHRHGPFFLLDGRDLNGLLFFFYSDLRSFHIVFWKFGASFLSLIDLIFGQADISFFCFINGDTARSKYLRCKARERP